MSPDFLWKQVYFFLFVNYQNVPNCLLYCFLFLWQDFIQQYCVILPRGMLSSRDDILALFQSLDINEQNYQLGKTKVGYFI